MRGQGAQHAHHAALVAGEVQHGAALARLVGGDVNELAAEAAYAKSKVELDRVTGQTLNNSNISLTEAFKGVVSRSPQPLPATDAPLE